jgi:hypothetical protein
MIVHGSHVVLSTKTDALRVRGLRFAAHGIKAQGVYLPNGLIGSIYLASWRNSDSGVLNMSGLPDYLQEILRDSELHYIYRNGIERQELPALYADGIFPQLVTIMARYRNPNELQGRVNRRLASVRQTIEHLSTRTFPIVDNRRGCLQAYI